MIVDALKKVGAAIGRMADAPNFSLERAKAIASYYKALVGVAVAVRNTGPDEAQDELRRAFGGSTPADFEGTTSGGSSTAPEPPDEEVWSDAAHARAARRRRPRRRRNDDQGDDDIRAALGTY